MSGYRSLTTTTGRNMAGARALWRATGMTDADLGKKPIIAIANSFTQFVPGHVHLHDVGQRVKSVIDAAGGWGVEFDPIAIDDGIAMGHGGMLYSLPSRELIADSVEYMVNGHRADALVCISNCDKITPGMMLAAVRLNIPAIFVSGGPMEAGRTEGKPGTAGGERKLDLIDAMVASSDPAVSDQELARIEADACPTCGSCSGMFTANSMNCLNEAIGLALPGNGTLLATHAMRWSLFEQAGRRIVEMANRYYLEGDRSVLPRSIATFDAFENAMALDIAMGGSTNTVLHLLAIAEEAGVKFTMADIDRLSRSDSEQLQGGSFVSLHVEELTARRHLRRSSARSTASGLIHRSAGTVHAKTHGGGARCQRHSPTIGDAEARERAWPLPEAFVRTWRFRRMRGPRRWTRTAPVAACARSNMRMRKTAG